MTFRIGFGDNGINVCHVRNRQIVDVLWVQLRTETARLLACAEIQQGMMPF